MDQVVGGVLSAIPTERLPAADQRPVFADQLGRALGGRDHFSEHIRIAIVAARIGR